jgi:hypothetical protein
VKKGSRRWSSTQWLLWRTTAARSPWRRARRRLGSIYKRSCLGEGFTTNTHVSQGSRHGQGGGAAANSRPGAARRAYGGVAVGWPAQDGFVGPVSMRRVARTDWVRTSVRKTWDRRSQRCSGSRVRSGGGAARRGHAHDVARGCEPARFQFRVALFQHDSLQFFQLKWAE